MKINVNPTRLLLVWAVAMTVLGLSLRILGARGDLWLDEVHTLQLVGKVHSAGQVIWGINHDNNHLLNSLYIYVVGVDRSPLVLRGLSILLGTLTVPMAGMVSGGARRPLNSALAMLVFAVDYPLVHYGSEARGYSGLILFILAGIWALEKGIHDVRGQVRLGIILVLGVLSHFSMIVICGVLYVWRVWIDRKPGQKIFDIFYEVLVRFRFAILGIGLLGAVIVLGAKAHPVTIGTNDISLWDEVTTAYGMMLGAMVCFGQQSFGQSCLLAGVASVLLYAFKYPLRDQPRVSLYILAVVIMPWVLFETGMRNLNNERYYIAFAAIWLLLPIRLVYDLALQGIAGRLMAGLLLLAFLASNGSELGHFYRTGRGHYGDAVMQMTEDGPATYGTRETFGIGMVASYYARKLDRPLTMIRTDDWCATPPDWLVTRSDPDGTPPLQLTKGPAACPITFEYSQTFPFWGLSGWQWSTYRRKVQ
jgi:hypothetical protein